MPFTIKKEPPKAKLITLGRGAKEIDPQKKEAPKEQLITREVQHGKHKLRDSS